MAGRDGALPNMDYSDHQFKLLCLCRQSGKISRIIELLRRIGDGKLTEYSQECLLLCLDSSSLTVYHQRLLRAVILAVEADDLHPSDDIMDTFSACLTMHSVSDTGWTCKVFSYDKPEKLLKLHCSDNMLKGNTGCHEWEAGFRLAELLLNAPHLIKDSCILELGAGTGQASIVAHRIGAKRVICTDGDACALENCRKNMKMNGIESPDCRLLRWEDDNLTNEDQIYYKASDVVIAADIVYNPDIIPSLLSILCRLMNEKKTSSQALIVTTVRNETTLQAFVEAADSHPLLALEQVDCQTLESTHPPVRFHHIEKLDEARHHMLVHRITMK